MAIWSHGRRRRVGLLHREDGDTENNRTARTPRGMALASGRQQPLGKPTAARRATRILSRTFRLGRRFGAAEGLRRPQGGVFAVPAKHSNKALLREIEDILVKFLFLSVWFL